MVYISRNNGVITRIRVLGNIDKKSGIAKQVKVLENGYLNVESGAMLDEFQLINGILKFVPANKEVLLK